MADRKTLWKRNKKTEAASGDRKQRRLSKVIRWGFGFLVMLLGWTVWNFSARYDNRIYSPDKLDVVPERSVALVFGAGYWENGALSDILRDRLMQPLNSIGPGK